VQLETVKLSLRFTIKRKEDFQLYDLLLVSYTAVMHHQAVL